VVVSRHSVGHGWVAVEVDWAVERGRSIVVCLFDDSDPAAVHQALAESPRRCRKGSVDTVDFREHMKRRQQLLAKLLDNLSHRPSNG